jgi:hypothetical protein
VTDVAPQSRSALGERDGADLEDYGPEVPPVGEEIHMPGPTILPFVNAIGITLIVVGTTIGWGFSIVGLIIFIITAVRWIRDTRRDVGELPEQHLH